MRAHRLAVVPLALALLAAAACGGSPETLPVWGPDAGASLPPGGYVPSDLVPPPADGFQLAMDEFVVPAGGQAYLCQAFQLPIGVTSFVGSWDIAMAKGSHHLLVFRVADPGAWTHVAPCDGGGPPGFSDIVVGAQQPTATVTYPAGVGYQIDPREWVIVQAHYLNATDAPLLAQVDVNAHLVAPATVAAHAGSLFFDPLSLTVPPGPAQQLTYRCVAPQDMEVFGANGHMHRHGTELAAELDGAAGRVPLFDHTTWDDPPTATFAPPLHVVAGDTFQWTCTFDNDTGAPLVYGNSALTNEMCILYGAFYPVQAQATIYCVPCPVAP